MGSLREFFDSVLSESGDAGLSRLQRFVRFGYLLAIYGGKQLVRHRAPQLAAALAYRTIFSLVPVLVLVLLVLNATFDKAAIERAFDAVFEYTGLADIQVPAADPSSGEDIDPELIENGTDEEVAEADPDPDGVTTPRDFDDPYAFDEFDDEQGEQRTVALTSYLSEFVDRAADRVTNLSFGVITISGLVVFLYAAISLLIQVEAAFNVVTGARRGRRLTTRLINYWAVLTLGTILIVVSLAVGQIYQSRLAELPGWLAAPLTVLGRFGATWLLLVLAYMLMPTARVFVKPAAIGAAVAAIAWETSKSALFWFVAEMTGGQAAIYGSLAVLPVALLWIYITWFIVLFGLELAYSIQTVREIDLRRSLRGKIFDDEPMVDTFSPVLIMAEVARGFAEGRAVSLDDARDQVAEPESVVGCLVQALHDAGYLHTVEAEEEEETCLALARAPETITVADILAACDSLFEPSAAQHQGQRGRALTRQLRERRNEAFSQQTLAQLAIPSTRTAPPPPKPEDTSS